MGKLVQLLLNRGTYKGVALLQPKSIERMETPGSTLAAERGLRAGYSLGNATTAEKGFLFHGHSGAIDGFLADYGYAPEQGVGFFYALNASNPEALGQIGKLIGSYLTRDLEKPVPPVGDVSADRLQRFAGFYEPFTPRLELIRFLERLLGVVHLDTRGQKLEVVGLSGQPRELIPVTDTSLRGTDDPIASVVLVEDGPDGVVLQGSSEALNGNYRPIPAWLFWLQGATVIVCLLLMVSSVLFALVWVPRKLFGRLQGVKHLSVRALPLLAVLCLVGVFVLIAASLEATLLFSRFGTMTAWSVGLWALTWLFACAAILGLVQAFRARHLGVRQSVRVHALLVSAANVVVLAYLAYWGIIGLRSWA
jgi:hypothetical protein